MNYCSNCGSRVSEGSNFCANCGKRFSNPPNQYNQIQGPNQSNYYINSEITPRKRRSAGRIIGRIFLILGIIISIIFVLGFCVMVIGVGEYIDENKQFQELMEDDEELAVYCAKSTICQKNDVSEDDVNWKKVECEVVDKDGVSIVYIDCKFTDSHNKYNHIKWFVVIQKAKYDEDDGDIEWKETHIEWDEDNYTYDEQLERVKVKFDIDD